MNKSIIQRIRLLYEQELGIAKIAEEVGVSYATVRKILIDCGDLETEEARLFRQGLSVPEIAERLEKGEKAVSARIPYTKGAYKSDNPTQNALNIRSLRQKRRDNTMD